MSKVLYTKAADEMACANKADPDQTASQGLHCFLFHSVF